MYERTITEEEIILSVSNYIPPTIYLSNVIPYSSIKFTLRFAEHLPDSKPGICSIARRSTSII